MKTIPWILLLLLAGRGPLAAEETEAEDPIWSGNLGLSYLATSGNANTATGGLSFELERRPVPWGLDVKISAQKAEKDDTVAAERYYGSIQAVRDLTKWWGLFLSTSGEKDGFAGIEFRRMAGGGFKLKAVKSPDHRLILGFAITWTNEDRVPPEEDASFMGGLLDLDYRWNLSDTARLTQRLSYYPNFDTSSDWRFESETALQARVLTRMALKLSYELRYRNEPLEGRKATDTATQASVVLNF